MVREELNQVINIENYKNFNRENNYYNLYASNIHIQLGNTYSSENDDDIKTLMESWLYSKISKINKRSKKSFKPLKINQKSLG